MRRMILLFSHKLTDTQKQDAKKSYRVDEFLSMPEDIQKLWSNIPADSRDITEYLLPIEEFVEDLSSRGDVVLIQGDFGATHAMVNFCKSLGLVPLYATTKRDVVEKSIDGKVVKTSVFEHILFREYK